jgi:hypothetical protein
MGNYITFGKWNKHYKYLIFITISTIVKHYCYGYNYNNSLYSIFHEQSKANENFVQHNYINHLFSYFGLFITSSIVYYLEKNRSKSEDINYSKSQGLNASLSDAGSEQNDIKYLHDNNKTHVDIYYYSSSLMVFFVALIFIWVLLKHLIDLFGILKGLDFWMVELIIVAIMAKRMFKVQIYTHQWFILLLNLIPVFLKITTIILAFNGECKDQDDFDCYYTAPINNDTFRVFERLEIGYGSKDINEKKPYFYQQHKLNTLYKIYPWLIPIGVILYLGMMILDSYICLKLKWFMELKYMSSNKILMLFGGFGTLIIFFICIITTYLPCNTTYDIDPSTNEYNQNKASNFLAYLCSVGVEDPETNEKTYYFENFGDFFYTDEKIKRAFLTIFGTIGFVLYQFCAMFIIKNLTPLHLIFALPMDYFFSKIIAIIYSKSAENRVLNDEFVEFKLEYLCLDISGDLLSIIGFLVYLEIIELHFCGFEVDLRKNIMERATIDSINSNTALYINDDINNSEEN